VQRRCTNLQYNRRIHVMGMAKKSFQRPGVLDFLMGSVGDSSTDKAFCALYCRPSANLLPHAAVSTARPLKMPRFGLAAAFSTNMELLTSIYGIQDRSTVLSRTPIVRFVCNVRIFTFFRCAIQGLKQVPAQPPGNKLLDFLIQFGPLPIRRRLLVFILLAGSF